MIFLILLLYSFVHIWWTKSSCVSNQIFKKNLLESKTSAPINTPGLTFIRQSQSLMQGQTIKLLLEIELTINGFSGKKNISKESALISANNCLTHGDRSITDNPNAMQPQLMIYWKCFRSCRYID